MGGGGHRAGKVISKYKTSNNEGRRIRNSSRTGNSNRMFMIRKRDPVGRFTLRKHLRAAVPMKMAVGRDPMPKQSAYEQGNGGLK